MLSIEIYLPSKFVAVKRSVLYLVFAVPSIINVLDCAGTKGTALDRAIPQIRTLD